METIIPKRSVFLNGNPGVGKSVIIKSLINKLRSNLLPVESVFSAQTSANNLMNTFLDKYETRGNDLYPRNGMKALLYIDDVNMPKLDEYGA